MISFFHREPGWNGWSFKVIKDIELDVVNYPPQQKDPPLKNRKKKQKLTFQAVKRVFLRSYNYTLEDFFPWNLMNTPLEDEMFIISGV